MLLETPENAAEEQSGLEPRSNEPRNSLFSLALWIIAVGVVGGLAWDFLCQKEDIEGLEHNAVIGITIFIQAVIAFFGILNLEEPHRTRVSPLTKGGMRTAIAGALVLTYIFLVIFHTMMDFTLGSAASPSAASPSAPSPTRDAFISSFTWVVSITILFYFGSETAIHWINASNSKRVSPQFPSPRRAKEAESPREILGGSR